MRTRDVVAIAFGAIFFIILIVLTASRNKNKAEEKAEKHVPLYVLLDSEDTERTKLNITGIWENADHSEFYIEFCEDGRYQAEGDYASGTFEVHNGYVIMTSSYDTVVYLRFVKAENDVVLQQDIEAGSVVYVKKADNQGKGTSAEIREDIPVLYSGTEDERDRYTTSTILQIIRSSTWETDNDSKFQNPNFSKGRFRATDRDSNKSIDVPYSIAKARGEKSGFDCEIRLADATYIMRIDYIGEYGNDGYVLTISNQSGAFVKSTTHQQVNLEEPE